MPERDRRRTDTRDQIRSAAMLLFTVHGYEQTSLRQIAEHLGVTKAAVYYHFRTKEDIAISVSEVLRHGVDELIAWARSTPPSPQRSDGIIVRYSALVHDDGAAMARLWAADQTSLQRLGVGSTLRYQFRALGDLVAEPRDDPTAIYYARQALLAVSWSVSMTNDLDITDERKRDEAVTIAQGILAGRAEHTEPSTPSPYGSVPGDAHQ